MSAAGELWGIYGGGTTPVGEQWLTDLEVRLRQHRFRSVVLQIKDCCLKDEVEGAGYVDKGPLIPQNDDFYNWRTPRTPEAELYVAPD
jgi:hypothetical protein